MKFYILLSFIFVYTFLVHLTADVSLEEITALKPGEPMLSEKGVYFSRQGDGYINLRIEENRFIVVFLNSKKEVIIPKNINKVLLIAENVRGEEDRENYKLEPSVNRIFYSHPRYIEKPYIYRVKLRITTEEQEKTPSTASGLETVQKIEEHGFEFLNQ